MQGQNASDAPVVFLCFFLAVYDQKIPREQYSHERVRRAVLYLQSDFSHVCSAVLEIKAKKIEEEPVSWKESFREADGWEADEGAARLIGD